jgi:hypothetical protein
LGNLGMLGILGIENRKLKYFLPSFPAGNNNQKKFYFFYFNFFNLTAARRGLDGGGRTGVARRGGQTEG